MYIARESLLFLLALCSVLFGESLGKRRRGERRRVSPEVLEAGRQVVANITAPRPVSIFSTKYDHPKPANLQVGCKELRSKRYVSDGDCTSNKPIMEVVCTGHCLPIRNLPWYAEFIKVWSRTKTLEWRCVNDIVRRKKVRLVCSNGDTRSYKLKVVKSCKCKKYTKRQNQSKLLHLKSEGKKRLRRTRSRMHRNGSN